MSGTYKHRSQFKESDYRINTMLIPSDLTYYQTTDTTLVFHSTDIITAMVNCNVDILQQFRDAEKYVVPLIKNVTVKGVSGAIGECYGQHLAKITKTLQKNPHEAGAPDFLPIVEDATPWMRHPTKQYYPTGGFDTKAVQTAKKEFSKVSAASHHDETTTVLVVQWTKNHEGVPEVIGIYYTNKLTSADWRITHSRPGSKTTNGGSLSATGKKKLRAGWIVLHTSVKLPSRKIKNLYGL